MENVKTATFVTVLLAITSFMFIGMSKAPEVSKQISEVECLRPNGSVRVYETHSNQITNRAGFHFYTIDGMEVNSSFCHRERRVR